MSSTTSTILTPEQKFEQTLLSALMRDTQTFSKVLGILKPKFFTNERRQIFDLIKDHYRNFSNPPNIPDVEISIKNIQNQDTRNKIFQELQALKTLELPGVDKLCDEALKFAKDALYLEALEIGSEGLLTKDDDLKKKAEKILDERAKLNIDSDLGIEFSDTSEIIDYYDQKTDGLLTQHFSLNTRLGSGFLPGTLNVILAPSGIGKSLLMTDLISGWVKQGKNCLLVSLEMSDKEVMKRVHANALEIPIADLSPGNFDRARFVQKLNKAKQSGCGSFWVKDFPAGSFSALQLESLVESYKNEKNVVFDVVLVDYLGIAKSDLLSPSAGLYNYVKSIAEEFRAVAKKLQIPLISASQLNRSAVNNLESSNDSVSDSLGTVMTADFLLFLLQTDEMKQNGEIIAKITKNRYTGKTETFPLNVNYELMRFEDPDIPKSLEARKELKEQFDFNAESCEKLLEEHNAKELERLNKPAQPAQQDEYEDLNAILKELM